MSYNEIHISKNQYGITAIHDTYYNIYMYILFEVNFPVNTFTSILD